MLLGIIVEFSVEPRHLVRFQSLVDENARLSALSEPGCLQFDVLWSKEQPERLVLYEIYRDEAAFEIHLSSSHFLQFDRESAPLIQGKEVRRFVLGTSNVHAPDIGAT